MLSNYVLYEQSRKDSRFAAATQTGIQMPEIVGELRVVCGVEGRSTGCGVRGAWRGVRGAE